MNDDMNCTLKNLLENAHLLQPPKNLNCVDDKKDAEWEVNFDVTAAFLGPTLWSKTLTYDGDLKLDYMDLDDILAEDNMKSTNHEDEDHVKASLKLESDQDYDESSSSSSLKSGCYDDGEDEDDDGLRQERRLIPKVEAVFTAEDLALALAPGQKNFDPTSHKFTADDLKPQPMYKKSKKQFVPSEQKDDKYWSRRKKNNMAAKRSRDARRIKENQIALRASFLERENSALKKQLVVLRDENALLAAKIDSLIQ